MKKYKCEAFMKPSPLPKTDTGIKREAAREWKTLGLILDNARRLWAADRAAKRQ